MMGERGWFADWDDEADAEYGWQPCLETGYGHIPSFEVWFKSKADCEDFIRKNVIGIGWHSGEPTETGPAPSACTKCPPGKHSPMRHGQAVPTTSLTPNLSTTEGEQHG